MTPRKNQFKSRLKDLATEDFSHADNFFTPIEGEVKLSSSAAVDEEVWMATPDGYDGQLVK